MIKPKLHLSMLILVLTGLLFSACSESRGESIPLLDTLTPDPLETPGKMTPDNLEIESGEKCSFKIPKTLALLAIEAFPGYDIDDDYIHTSLPKNLCICSYPINSDGYYIVLFKGPIYEEYKGQIESLGGILHSYIPKNGFVVKMNETIKDKVEKLEIIEWVGIYQPAYKISVNVKWDSVDPPVREVSMPLLTRTGAVTLTVGVFGGETVADIVNQIESIGGTVSTIYGTSQNKFRVWIDATKIPDIANIVGVEFISEYRMPEINDN